MEHSDMLYIDAPELPEYWEHPSTLVSDQSTWYIHRQVNNVWEPPTTENFVEDIIRGATDKHINLTKKAPAIVSCAWYS